MARRFGPRTPLGACCFIFASILASAATAQVAPAPDPAVEPPSAAAETADEQQGGIRDIIVTAQRREERLQSVPVAVSALDATALASNQVNDLRDIAGRVPSLVIDNVNAGPSAAAISIRGISFEDIEKSFDPAVGVVVDGVFIGTNTGQLLDSFDMERLEVLRGPQGTLFGRNTIGGVINVTRTRPTDEAGLKASFSYANYDTKRARVVANTGLLGGFIAIKAFAFWDKTAGYYRNVTQNRRDGRYETLSGGVTARITPFDGLTAVVTYEHERERGEVAVAPVSQSGQDLICLVPGAPGFSPANECNRNTRDDLYTTFSQIQTPVRADTDAVTANIDLALGSGFALTSVTGYRSSKESVRQDFDASSAQFFETFRPQDYEQFSQEVRIVGDLTDSLNLLIGGYYFTSNYQIDQQTQFGVLLGQGSTPTLRQYVDHKGTSYAGFADAKLKLTDQLAIGGGLRYTRDEKRIFNNYGRIGPLVQITQPNFDGRSCVTVTGTLTPAPGVVLPAYSPASNCSGAEDFGKLTFRGHIDWQIDRARLVYLSYSRGFRSGGFNGRAASPTSLGPYQPETVDAYEAGLKADWLNGTLRTNVAAYVTKYNNKQEEIVQPAPPGASSPQETVVRNASSATIKGAELELIAQPSRSLNFTASFSYTDANFDGFFNDINGDNIPDDVSTLKLRRAPKVQWSTGVNYTREIGGGRFDAGALLRYQSEYYTCIVPAQPAVVGQVINDPRCLTQNRENLSAQVGYTFEIGTGQEISLSVFGRNITDFRDQNSTLPVAGLFSFAGAIPPRTYGVELGVKF